MCGWEYVGYPLESGRIRYTDCQIVIDFAVAKPDKTNRLDLTTLPGKDVRQQLINMITSDPRETSFEEFEQLKCDGRLLILGNHLLQLGPHCKGWF